MADFGVCGHLLPGSATGELVESCNSGSLKVPNKSRKISVRIDCSQSRFEPDTFRKQAAAESVCSVKIFDQCPIPRQTRHGPPISVT
jgi:hypothetical protein